MKKKRKEKIETKSHTQTKATLDDQKQHSEVNTTSTEATAPAPATSVNKPITGCDSAGSGHIQHGEVARCSCTKVPSFTKKRVASTEETAHSGHFKSGLRADVAKASSPRSAVNEYAIEDDPSDSPSASLVLSAPVYKEVNGQLEQQFSAEPVSERPTPDAPKPSSSPCSLIKTLVNLFAGRRKSDSKPDTNSRHARSSSVAVPMVTITDRADIKKAPRVQSECAPTPPLTPLSPPSPRRLTHRQVIPPVTRREGDAPSRRSGFRNLPPAPMHRTMGTGVMCEDTFKPTNVQRGFHVPSPAQASAAIEQRRNNSASTLLDRDGDVWACWHAKYATQESHPFSKPAAVGAV
jgi:hypothetical protein